MKLRIIKTSLSLLFPNTNFVSYAAYDELRDFASHYDEMRYDEFKNRIVFRGNVSRGSVIFTISVSQSGGFKGTIFNVNDDVNDNDLLDTGTRSTITRFWKHFKLAGLA